MLFTPHFPQFRPPANCRYLFSTIRSCLWGPFHLLYTESSSIRLPYLPAICNSRLSSRYLRLLSVQHLWRNQSHTAHEHSSHMKEIPKNCVAAISVLYKQWLGLEFFHPGNMGPFNAHNLITPFSSRQDIGFINRLPNPLFDRCSSLSWLSPGCLLFHALLKAPQCCWMLYF